MPIVLQGQGETNNWYFGENAGIRFNTDGSIESLTDGAMNSIEGCASISDNSGGLLFYTDGETIFNRNHEIMVNGLDIGGSTSSTQSAIIVPLPDSETIYYIFTVDATFLSIRGNGLNYTIVDMSLDNGNGAVTSKNINLLPDCAEKLTSVVRSCTDNSIWVLAFATETGQKQVTKPNFDTFHAFLLDSSGVSTSSITSTFNSISTVDDQGYIKFSADGNKLASANYYSGLHIFDFDRSLGEVNNHQEITINATNTIAYGIEFSLSGRYLYATTYNRVYPLWQERSDLLQYDLEAADISASQIIIDDNRVLFRGALQMGINGKIYRAVSDDYFTGLPYLGVINEPENPGLSSDYVHEGLILNGGISKQGLPQFVTSFFNTIELAENESSNLSICEGEELLIEAQLIPGATYSWEKDGNSFTNSSNRHIVPISTFEDAGVYTVTILRPNALECPVTGETTLAVSSKPIMNPQSLNVCDLDTENSIDGITTINLNQLQVDTSLSYQFYLSQADLDADNPITEIENFSNTTPFNQTIFIKVANAGGCSSINQAELTIYPVLALEMEENYILCKADVNSQITAPIGFDVYEWYFVSETSEVLIENGTVLNNVEQLESGTYILQGTTNYGNASETFTCETRISFTIEVYETAIIEEVLVFDNGTINSIEIIVTGDGDYEYSIDGANFQEDNRIEGVPSGAITVYVRDKNGCGVSETTKDIDKPVSSNEFPKFFTPNGDGINDFWNYKPLETNNDIDINNIYIYNRYGQLLIQINPESQGWDGTFNGQLQPATDYWYRATTFQNSEVRGHFSLKI